MIGCINIAWYHGDTRSNSFQITALDENMNDSSVVYRGISSGTTLAPETYTLSNVESRYLKITINGNTENSWASINEIEVLSPAKSFRHPGVLVTQEQLEYVSRKISNFEAPWRSVYERAFGGRFGSQSYSAKPRDIVNCAEGEGCTDEKSDAIAAYTQALLWRYTGDASYAERSIAIMNAWSGTITDHTGSSAPLQAGWAAEVWPRATEIIRYTYSGWSSRDIERFERMLRDVYLPEVQNGWWGGNNWDLTMIDATMAIAVFTEDRDLFNHAIEMWRGSVPAYIYLETDGALPNRPRIGSFSDEELRTLWKNPPDLSAA